VCYPGVYELESIIGFLFGGEDSCPTSAVCAARGLAARQILLHMLPRLKSISNTDISVITTMNLERSLVLPSSIPLLSLGSGAA
jgi:hypothetical protein